MSPQRRRLRLIVNPVAANVTGRSRRAVLDALVVHAVSVVETTEPDHATALARGAAADGVDAVVVLGGDGTVSEAANGLMEAGTGTTLV
ncbi:MAG: acylglycerol kinase family protein, partial [Actinomycetota bacterium]|nr:acylglycerol kinase family protein [Actinomycetota bacterium]